MLREAGLLRSNGHPPNDPFENGLPSSVEAERSILGAILLDNSVSDQAIALLRREDFFLDSHRRLFDVMISLTERAMPIDLITLSDELRTRNEFEQIGGATYIASLIDGVPRTDTIEPYARLIKNKADLRAFIAVCEDARNRAFDSDELAELRDRIVSALNQIEDGREAALVHASKLSELPTAQFIKDTKIVARGLNVWFGASGAFKTFLALDSALRVSQSSGVVYVGAEGASGFNSRVESWCSHHKKDFGSLYFHLNAVNLLSESEVARLFAEIKRLNQPISLVVFDTLSRCLVGGDENSAKDIGLAIDNCTTIQRLLDCAVLVIHHTNRAENGERGSGALRGAADSMIEISKVDDLIVMECSKLKDSREWSPSYYKFVEIFNSGVLLPAREVVGVLSDHQRKILEALEAAGGILPATELMEAADIPAKNTQTFRRAKTVLLNKRLISQADRRKPYEITELGRKLLQSDENDSENGERADDERTN